MKENCWNFVVRIGSCPGSEELGGCLWEMLCISRETALKTFVSLKA